MNLKTLNNSLTSKLGFYTQSNEIEFEKSKHPFYAEATWTFSKCFELNKIEAYKLASYFYEALNTRKTKEIFCGYKTIKQEFLAEFFNKIDKIEINEKVKKKLDKIYLFGNLN